MVKNVSWHTESREKSMDYVITSTQIKMNMVL